MGDNMNHYKVLIVDDDEFICHNIESKLLRLNCETAFEIRKAYDACAAISVYGEMKPDILITDIKMPGMSGLSLVEAIRRTDKDILIFILSGYDDFNYVRQAFLAGVTDYLLKPLSFSELGDKLRKHTGARAENEKVESDIYLIDRAVSYIQNNLGRPFTMEEVAGSCSISYNYFSKWFKDQIGIPFSKYVNLKRMEYARELLEDPMNLILNIAKKVGFDNPQHFSRAFKRTYGVYPYKYRKNHDALGGNG